jgi:hypothetical protein
LPLSLEVHSALCGGAFVVAGAGSEVAQTEVLVAESVLISELILILLTGAGFFASFLALKAFRPAFAHTLDL